MATNMAETLIMTFQVVMEKWHICVLVAEFAHMCEGVTNRRVKKAFSEEKTYFAWLTRNSRHDVGNARSRRQKGEFMCR